MSEPTCKSGLEVFPVPELTDEDVSGAMREIPGYLDITPGDFRELYRLAFRQAVQRLTRGVKAADVMTREVVWVSVATPIAEVAEVMGKSGVSGLPVLDADARVAGVISERDFLDRLGVGEPKKFLNLLVRCLKTGACMAPPLGREHAADLMSAPAVTVGPDTPVADIAALFAAKGINRAPVADAEGRLLGIISRADLVKAVFQKGCPCSEASSEK